MREFPRFASVISPAGCLGKLEAFEHSCFRKTIIIRGLVKEEYSTLLQEMAWSRNGLGKGLAGRRRMNFMSANGSVTAHEDHLHNKNQGH